MRTFALCLHLAILLSLPAWGKGELPDSFVTAAETAKSVQVLDGRFEQEKQSLLFAEPQKSTGRFTFRRPDSVRWSYDGMGSFLGINGKTWWLNSEGKAAKFDLPIGGNAAASLSGLMTLDPVAIANGFTVSEIAGTDPALLSFLLVPKEKGGVLPFASVELSLLRKGGIVHGLVLNERSGDRTVIRFLDLKADVPIEPGWLEPPQAAHN